jgi:hypothetical protein
MTTTSFRLTVRTSRWPSVSVRPPSLLRRFTPPRRQPSRSGHRSRAQRVTIRLPVSGTVSPLLQHRRGGTRPFPLPPLSAANLNVWCFPKRGSFLGRFHSLYNEFSYLFVKEDGTVISVNVQMFIRVRKHGTLGGHESVTYALLHLLRDDALREHP